MSEKIISLTDDQLTAVEKSAELKASQQYSQATLKSSPGKKAEAEENNVLFTVGIVTRGEVFYHCDRNITPLRAGDLFCYITFRDHRLFGLPNSDNYIQLGMPVWELFECICCERSQLDLFLGYPVIITLSDEDKLMMDRWPNQIKETFLRKLALEEIKLAIRRSVFLSGNPTRGSAQVVATSKADTHTYKMIRFIWLNYTSDIDLSSVASYAGLNKNFAMGMFKKKLGISILQFITRLRLNHAAKLLTLSDKQITDIAYQSGFTSVTRFYEVFRAFYNEPPMKFRQKSKNLSLDTSGTQQLTYTAMYSFN